MIINDRLSRACMEREVPISVKVEIGHALHLERQNPNLQQLRDKYAEKLEMQYELKSRHSENTETQTETSTK